MNARNDTPSEPSKGTHVDEAITTLIKDLKSRGQLSEEQLQAVAGGTAVTMAVKTASETVIHMHTYTPNSSTFDNDFDYQVTLD
jgi:hypothetical protein